jgi:hypothetical protein
MVLLPLFVGVRGALLRGKRGSEEGDSAEPGRSGAVDETASEADEPPPADIDGRRCDIGRWRQGRGTAWLAFNPPNSSRSSFATPKKPNIKFGDKQGTVGSNFTSVVDT